MSQAIADNRDIHAGRELEAGGEVAQLVQRESWQPVAGDQLFEAVGDEVRVLAGAVLTGEDQSGVLPGRSQASRSSRCCFRHAWRTSAVPSSMSTIDSDPSVLGLDSTTLCRAAVRCHATSTVRASRSTSCQRNPHSSPRRRPVMERLGMRPAGIIRREGLVEGRTGVHPDAPFALYRL